MILTYLPIVCKKNETKYSLSFCSVLAEFSCYLRVLRWLNFHANCVFCAGFFIFIYVLSYWCPETGVFSIEKQRLSKTNEPYWQRKYLRENGIRQSIITLPAEIHKQDLKSRTNIPNTTCNKERYIYKIYSAIKYWGNSRQQLQPRWDKWHVTKRTTNVGKHQFHPGYYVNNQGQYWPKYVGQQANRRNSQQETLVMIKLIFLSEIWMFVDLKTQFSILSLMTFLIKFSFFSVSKKPNSVQQIEFLYQSI